MTAKEITRNLLHIILGLIVWNFFTNKTHLNWGEFALWKALVMGGISYVVGTVCGNCHEWAQEFVSKGSFSDLDVKLTAGGFVLGGLLAYAFNVPIWLFSVAIGVYVLDWVRIIFKWEI